MRDENEGPPRRARLRSGGGFTLVEVLTVVAVIGILLVVGAGAYSSTGTSQRRVALGEVQGMLTRARSHAISSGVPTALVVVGWTSGPDAMRGRALTTFEVRRDATSGKWVAGDQLRRWVYLPGATMLMGGSVAGETGGMGSNLLDEPVLLRVGVPAGSAGRKEEVDAAFVVFEATGAVSHPSGSGRIEFFIGEGVWRAGSLTVTGRTSSGEAVVDRVVLGRLTGRAQSVSSLQQ